MQFLFLSLQRPTLQVDTEAAILKNLNTKQVNELVRCPPPPPPLLLPLVDKRCWLTLTILLADV